MSLFGTLTEKSWEHRDPDSHLSGAVSAAPERIALRFFLGVVGVMFTLFIIAYFIRMELADWRPMPESLLLWINTLILFISSVTLQWTHITLDRGQRNNVKSGLLAGGILSLGFIFGQLVVWQEMSSAGYYLYNNPANAFFYVLTGLHGLHILGGLWVWTRASFKVWFGANVEEIRLSVELCTVYWHFLLLVWLVLFALLSYT
jgi:cytochrome c oxidase subunit 3